MIAVVRIAVTSDGERLRIFSYDDDTDSNDGACADFY